MLFYRVLWHLRMKALLLNAYILPVSGFLTEKCHILWGVIHTKGVVGIGGKRMFAYKGEEGPDKMYVRNVKFINSQT